MPIAEQQISMEMFKGLLESAPDGIVIVDQRGVILLANTQVERLFGYAPAELIGQAVEILVPESLRKLHQRHRERYGAEPHTRAMGAGLDLVARRKDGSTFPTEISLSPFRGENGVLITAVIRDITERKRAADELERQVQHRTAHLNALLRFSSELLLARSLDAVLQQALNHAMALVPDAASGAIYLHDDQTAALGLRASSGFAALPPVHLDAALPWIERAAAQRQVRQVAAAEADAALSALTGQPQPGAELLLAPLVAHTRPVGVMLLIREQAAGALPNDAGATLEGLANLTAAAILEERSRAAAASLTTQLADVTEQQRRTAERLTTAEAAMLQAARLSAIGQLAASIAHEINNPLYAARNCLFLLEEDLADGRGDSPYLEMARDQLARIATIIERMRDFYRPQRGDLSLCDLNRLAEDTLTLAGLNLRQGAIQMIFAPATDLQPVLANGDQLRQVLLNLVLNAIDAMPDGGTLTVRTRSSAELAVVEIQDTGQGIPQEYRARLFEPFFTSKSNGTGLGLAISAHIVTQHDGRIEVESEEGIGTIFRVLLPYAAPA
ncbi:MAG TPA: PAS domain S-box protein [Herpetosiphonaceae bacterium]